MFFLCLLAAKGSEEERMHLLNTVMTVSINTAYSAVPQQLYSRFIHFPGSNQLNVTDLNGQRLLQALFVLLWLWYTINHLDLTLYVGQELTTSWHAFRVASSRQSSEPWASGQPQAEPVCQVRPGC